MSLPLVDVHGVCRTYPLAGGQVEALREIDLRIDRGEHVAVTGRSGSGKSTLLQVLGALDPPTSGSYRFAGEDVGSLDDLGRSRLRSRHIGFVFQAFHLLPQLDVEQNVALPLMYRDDVSAASERVQEALRAVGLLHRRHHRPSQLSGGEQQRVAIARAVVGRPELLLADEPTGNLDEATAASILEVLEALNRAGAALVVVTHDEEIAARAARRVRLNGGRIDA